MLPTVRLIWWPDSQTPTRSTAVILPSCPNAVSRAGSALGIVLLPLTHLAGVQEQAAAERRYAAGHEYQHADSKKIQNGDWIRQPAPRGPGAREPNTTNRERARR